MLVKYYKTPELAYTNRKRYRFIDKFTPDSQENQRSVLLGNGATTSIKTSANNICNYVTIDDTRWYVTSYTYMNGGQVTLNLQRDVVGEFGLTDCYGKIDRGFTDSFLKNRKELQLNQILKSRKPLVPSQNLYGGYTINTHNKEKWGILYIKKPTGIDPNTGKPYESTVTVNIPALAPKALDYDFIESGTTYNVSINRDGTYDFEKSEIGLIVKLNTSLGNGSVVSNAYYIVVRFIPPEVPSGTWSYIKDFYSTSSDSNVDVELDVRCSGTSFTANTINKAVINHILDYIASDVLNNSFGSYRLPEIEPITSIGKDYDNITVVKDGKYYRYDVINGQNYGFGSVQDLNTQSGIENFRVELIKACNFEFRYPDDMSITTISSTVTVDSFKDYFPNASISAGIGYNTATYTATELSPSESGDLVIDTTVDLVDEPYVVLVFPLYQVSIQGNNSSGQYVTYNIDQEQAFTVFNSVIQFLSGDNGYLVDAQIYPYCPQLTSVSSEVNGYPFFTVAASSYERVCKVQLLPSSDVKKEYIQREYSIVSPEKTGKFTFNYYDYVNTIENVDGVNRRDLTIIIKTALKPFSIISSAVVIPESGALVGETYPSDLRGCCPSCNGFECSLSSNAFETYRRNNSNYQEIFNLQKEELKTQHNVETANEAVSAVMNTLTAASMGALAGRAMGDLGLLNLAGTGGGGAIAGAAAAGGTAGIAMATQLGVNLWARGYERELQQQRFDLDIGTIKNLPNTVSRISTFNEIMLKEFYYVVETYECSELEKLIVDNFISEYGYSIGVYDFLNSYIREGWFLKATLIKSTYNVNLHEIAKNDLAGGIYYYEQS